MTFDDMLRQAIDETADERATQMLVVENKHRFSLTYRLWERKMLRDIRRERFNKCWTLKKARAVVVSVFAALSVLMGATAFAAVSIGRYYFDQKHDYSKMFIENHPSDKTRFEEYYGLPEEDGWNIVEFHDLQDTIIIKYELGEKKVSFYQEIICENMGNVNTENAMVEPMSLYEDNDGFFIAFQDGGCGLWWIYDGYLLKLFGDLTKDELVDLAKTAKNIDLSSEF